MSAVFYNRTDTFVQGSTTLPGEYFTTQEIFDLERERIWLQRWVCVGRSSQAGTPGEYFLANLGTENLIVVRDQTGGLNAFYNVCRHRGTRICVEPMGRFSESIQCPYHAWTYAIDGRLIGAPFMNEVAGFEAGRYGLHSAAAAEWEGFIFVSLSENPTSFAQEFAALIGRFSRFNLPLLHTARAITYDVNANWKLIIQNYSECLHCPTLHPGLARISPFQSGENDLVEGTVLGGYMEIGPKAESLTKSGRICGLPVGDLPASDHKRVYYYTIFPNLLLSMHPDYVMFHRILPQTPNRTAIHCEWMFHSNSFDQAQFEPDDAIDFWDLTNRQDWEICERSQAGISSRAYRPGPYSARESLPAAWDREYLRSLAMPDA